MQCSMDRVVQWIAQSVIASGGEGAILIRSLSPYQHGRVDDLLKIKHPSHFEQEGIVTEVFTDNSVSLQLSNGNVLTIPASNIAIPTPAVGNVVTFSFEAKTVKSSPENASIFRIRTDMAWDDFLENSNDLQASGANSFVEFQRPEFNNKYNGLPKAQLKQNTQEQSWGNVAMRRGFFESYAKSNAFDPLNPANWYNVSRQKLSEVKGLSRILHYHQHSISQALVDLFPNIGLDRLKFSARQQLWEDPNNRKRFFENYALRNGFDPLVPENWYSVPRDLLAEKSKGIIVYHNHSVFQALIDLFPDIGLDKSKFGHEGYWKQATNRKRVFQDYATKTGFDPDLPANWYSQSKSNIMAFKNVAKVLVYHRNSLVQALFDLFPNFKLYQSKFRFS